MKKYQMGLAVILVVSGCAGVATVGSDTDYGNAALAMMKADFKSKGPATLERMAQQDEA
jgi:sulfur-oxidizing protein SoxX